MHQATGEDEYQLSRAQLIGRGMLEALAEEGDQVDEGIVVGGGQEKKGLTTTRVTHDNKGKGAGGESDRAERQHARIEQMTSLPLSSDLLAVCGKIGSIGVLLYERGRKDLTRNTSQTAIRLNVSKQLRPTAFVWQ